jgi:hypothetical protein
MVTCNRLAEKYKFVISTEEMNAIFECVGKKYVQEIKKLREDNELYKQQISRLIKDQK